MKTNPHTRRMFLQGTGGFLLAIPTLSSLLARPERAAAQATTPIRYVQWITNHGQFEQNFWPAQRPTDAAMGFPDIKARALTSITGPMSAVLGPEFDPVRGKMNLLRGLDLMHSTTLHNSSAATCGSWPRNDDSIPTFAHSVDSILEKSKKVYPTGVRVPALRITPGNNPAYASGSFCWTTQNGKPFRLPCLDKTEAALNAVFKGATTSATGAVDPALAARRRLTDQVLEDYKRVAGSRVLGSADKQQLSHYMDLLADVQQRMSIEAPACTPPSQLANGDYDVLHKNAIDICVAAMLCGATRIVAYHCYQGSPTAYDEDTFHTWAHNDAAKHAGLMTWRYKQFARLMKRMDEFTDPDGKTLLDNSFVYGNNELAEPSHGGKHLQSMPVITGGSAGGRLVTGQYIDYGKRLVNNVFTTIYAAMGLEPADYELGGAGFGEYSGKNAEAYSAYLPDAERRKPLPYLYRG